MYYNGGNRVGVAKLSEVTHNGNKNMQDQSFPQNANVTPPAPIQGSVPGGMNAADATDAASSAAPVDNATANVASAVDNAPKVTVQSSTQPGVAPKITKTEAQPIVSREEYIRKIGEKIRDSENILVALSRNPSVDEMSAAIGLTLFLDTLQKHVTAIYSGKTPDALHFLRPEATFEANTASLQDFIIALNKEKADHLRYKVEGDFVKVFITPYKTTISEKDLEFSHGDYNVDLVLALNVPMAADLDEALSEHGRIMHNATAVDITVGVPGRFGEIEWSDPAASSVSEMIADLIFDLEGKDKVLDKEIATALLTGIVAATQRFSNDRTSAEALELASKLMSFGADQQLITANVSDNKIETGAAPIDLTPTEDTSNLAVEHTAEPEAVQPAMAQLGAAQAGTVQPAMSLDASMTTTPPEPPKDYAQMMADALAMDNAQNAANVMPANDYSQVPEAATAPIEAPPTVMPEAVAQNLPSAEQLTGQIPETMMQNTEQAQVGQMPNNMTGQTEQMIPGGGLPMPPENVGAEMPAPVAPMTGPEANPPVLPEVQVPVDLPELPQQAPVNNAPSQSGAFQIPGMS